MIESKCTGFLSIRQFRDGKLIKEIKDVPNLILNGGINTKAKPSLNTIPTFFTYTDTSPNYEDLDGTWSQSGNTVTRASGTGTFPSSPSQIGNELKWEDGERCHVVARVSDTEITVSGPPRTLTGKTIRRYLTNRTSTSGSSQSTSTGTVDTAIDLAAGTWERTATRVFDAAPSAYTMGSVMVAAWARIVLPETVEVEEFDQLEMTYKLQVTVSGREEQTIPISSVFSGWPYQFPVETIVGNGSTFDIETGEAHNFLAGDEIEILNAVPLRKAITGITSNGTTWTITAPSHDLSASDTVVIEDCTVGDYNGTHTVSSAPDANTITITNAANPGAASDGTVRLATPGTYFGGAHTVASIPGATTIRITSAIQGPAVDTSCRVRGKDEMTLRYWGDVFDENNGNNGHFIAYSETNAITVPSHTSGNSSWPGGSSHQTQTGSTTNSAFGNDFLYTHNFTTGAQWGAGGVSVPRIKQVGHSLRNVFNNGAGTVFYMLTLTTPQPKLNTHRLRSPDLFVKLTRDLPNY